MIVNDVRYTCPSTKISPLLCQPVMPSGAKHRNSHPTKILRSRQTPRLIPTHARESPLLIPLQHLMIVGPSFGLGEKAAPRKRGDTPSPFTGRAGEGLAEELPNSLTPAQLLFPRTRGNAPLLLPPHAGERKGAVTPSGIHRRNRACASRHGWERKGAVTPSGIHQPATSATPQQLGSPRAQILSRRLGREGGILMALVRSRQASSSLSHVKRSKA